MGINLFLDDYRQPIQAYTYTKDTDYLQKEWKLVKDYNSFTSFLQRKILNGEKLELVSFDHDLAPEHYAPEARWGDYDQWAVEAQFQERTGLDCAKYLVEFCKQYDIPLPKIKVHSMNPVGKRNIINLFENVK
jgi:hypothetical protein